MLNIVDPEAFVTSAVPANVDTVPVALVVHEFSLVQIAICVPKCALAFSPSINPVSSVLCPIQPHLHSKAVSYSIFIILLIAVAAVLDLPAVQRAV